MSVDPGKLTGFAIFDMLYLDDDAPTLVESLELSVDEYYTKLNELFGFDSRYGADIEVVMEDFKITAQTGKLTDAPWSLKLIGATEFACHNWNVNVTLQPPSRAKNFVPNDRLKALEFWHKGGAGHANDALRHGVLYMVEQLGWRPHNLLVQD